jgi:hypothetical protein
MYLLISAVLLIAVTVAFTLSVRAKDMPPPEPVSPVKHLEDRRAAIYENLRDLQFEYRVGKLSDADYQQTKVGLQKELAGVMAEMERIKSGVERPSTEPRAPAGITEPRASASGDEPAPSAEAPLACPHCGAEFPTPMKFCGECGKAMS